MTKKAAIYLRVSSIDQNYERQEIELKALAKCLGYEVKYIFEEKRSAVLKMDTRDELTQMRKLTKNEIYTCVCKVKFDDPNFMYPGLGDDNTRDKLYGYKNNFVTSPCDDVYIFSFKALSDYTGFIRLIGYQQTGGISTKSTFYWCFIAKGCVQNINHYIDKPFRYHLTYRTMHLEDTSVAGGFKTLNGNFEDNFLAIRWFDVNGDNEITKISVNNGKIYVGVKTPTLTNISVNINYVTTDITL